MADGGGKSLTRDAQQHRIERPLEVLKFIYRQRVRGFSPPGEPHFDEATTALFRSLLSKAKLYLEFGTGGSTLAAARQKVPTISVESDRHYAKVVRQTIGPDSSVELIHADIGVTGPWGRPLVELTGRDRREAWRPYVDLPFARLAANSSFPDLILIDGRFRIACALKSAREAARVGKEADLLFDDYFGAGREGYFVVEPHLGPPERHGRAALFRLSATPPRPIPTAAEVDEALRDFR